MSTHLRLTQLALVALFGLSFWGTLGLISSNGSGDFIKHHVENSSFFLTGAKTPITETYTGVAAIDKQLSILNIFFWSVLDGSNHPEYTLHLWDFSFQFAVMHGLCVLEGLRPGNSGRLISYTVIWGSIFQNFAVANTLPVFFLLYLATSPTVHGASLSTVLPSTSNLVTLPVSLILGYFVPVFAFSSAAISAEAANNWLAIWQAFPLWVSIFQLVLPGIVAPFLESGNGTDQVNANVEWLRTVYTVLKYLSTFGHISSYSLALRTFQSPHFFSSGIIDALNPLNVWVPFTIDRNFQVPDLGTGAHLFLQYDRIGSTAATVVWAYYLYSRTNIKKDASLLDNVWGVVKTVASVAFIGPAGAAVALLEARDETVLAQSGAGRKKVL